MNEQREHAIREQQISYFLNVLREAEDKIFKSDSRVCGDCQARVFEIFREIYQKIRPMDEPLRCSFCGVDQDNAVKGLVAGPCVMICGQCASSVEKILDDNSVHN